MSIAAGASALPKQGIARILEQDPTLNNLVDPPGYETGRLGELGAVEKLGHGPRAAIFIPGLGFGGDIFEPLTSQRVDDWTMYAVTLPGFGGTAAPPSPPIGTSFGEQTWTNGSLEGIENLIESESLDDVIVLGHWLTGTQIALRLALRNPDRVAAVILLAGSARFVRPTDQGSSNEWPIEMRVRAIDESMAPQWFKTVTRETWDDNNFLPGDYAVNPVIGLRLWRAAARPPLHVWVRYLCEFLAQDVTKKLTGLRARALLLQPGFEGAYVDGGIDYLEAYAELSWEGVEESVPTFTTQRIPESRVVLWYDRLNAVNEAIDAFVGSLEGS